MIRISFFPQSGPGRWSGWLLIAFLVLQIITVAVDIQTEGADPSWMALRGPIGFALAVGAGALATWAVARVRERSVTAFVAIVIGAFALCFEAVEFVASL